MPTRLAERWHVRQGDHALEATQRLGQGLSEMVRRRVAQRMKSLESRLGIKAGQLLDQEVIVEQHVGAGIISESPVSPTVVADQAGLGGQFHHARAVEPMESRRLRAEIGHPGADLRDATSVEIVVAEDEEDGSIE